ncbi:MAG: hypothetical protein IT290_04545 [Deltaproteobacteria bacterium]|nr:hypothetical protein [Deltaproteobacteria bacterium]
MSKVRVNVRGSQSAFRPFERISGSVSWTLDAAPKRVTINLLWHTSGRGTADVEVVASEVVSAPSASGSRDFTFELPEAPYSFSGSLITLSWAIEAIAEPSGDADQFEFVLAPNGQEVRFAGSEDDDMDDEDLEDSAESEVEDDLEDDPFEVDRDRFKK